MSLSEFKAKFQTRFLQQFHIDWPDEFLCDGLQMVKGCDLLSTASLNALGRILVGPIATTMATNSLPMNHHTVGWWGHGLNSYAFYFISRRDNETIYLRLHTGGAYTDTVTAAKEISDYLPAFIRMLRAAREDGGELLAIESMGKGHYRYAAHGKVAESHISLLGLPGCAEDMDALLALQDPADRFPDRALIDQIKGSCVSIAMEIYAVEMRRSGNERIGMRAIGDAMNIIRSASNRKLVRDFCQDLNGSLLALEQSHLDLDGEHDYGRACIGRLNKALESVLFGQD